MYKKMIMQAKAEGKASEDSMWKEIEHMDDMSDADIVAWAMTALTCLKIASVSYDIGDEVWTLDFFDEPHKGEILSINTYSHYKDKKRDYISYYIHHIGNRNEREIFKTKEELLKQGRK